MLAEPLLRYFEAYQVAVVGVMWSHRLLSDRRRARIRRRTSRHDCAVALYALERAAVREGHNESIGASAVSYRLEVTVA